MKTKKTIILGASGFIGKYLFKHLKNKSKNVIGTYNRNKKKRLVKFDITRDSVEKFDLENIDYCIICSAMTKIDECKKNLKKSWDINVRGLEKNLILLSNREITPVFISSTTVFDGRGNEKEEDPKNPVNIYGEQKSLVEDFILENIKNYLIIRLGKVFGLNSGEGSLFADWLSDYQKGNSSRCIYDEKISMTYVGDVVRGIELLLDENKRGVYNLDSPYISSRFEFAKSFFDFLGIDDVRIKRCSMDELKLLEKRARNAYLDSSKFISETNFNFTPLKEIWKIIKDRNF